MHVRPSRRDDMELIAPLAAPTNVFFKNQGGALDAPLGWCGSCTNWCGVDRACAASVCTDGSFAKALLHSLTWVLIVGLQFASLVAAGSAAVPQALLGISTVLAILASVMLFLTGGLVTDAHRNPLWTSLTLFCMLAALAINVAALGGLAVVDATMLSLLVLVAVLSFAVAQFLLYLVAHASTTASGCRPR